MEGATRTRLVALAVLLAVSVPLVLIAVAGGGDGEREPGGLRIESSAGGVPEMVIYVEDPATNEPDTNGGAGEVVIECLDGGGAVVFQRRERWPFTDTDGGVLDPHVHVSVTPPEAFAEIVRCRLKGTDPPLEGRKA